jgi:hypothetical protein
LRRRRRLLPIIGAGIVLLTFIVKDTWRDQVRGIADAVGQAEQIHFIREDSESLMRLTEDIYQRVRYPGNQDRDVDLIASQDSYQVYLVVFRLQQQISRRIDLIKDLIDKVGDQAGHRQQAKELEDRLTVLEGDLEKIGPSESIRTKGEHEIQEVSLPALTQVRRSTSGLWHAVESLDSASLKQAKVTKDRMEHWYSVWSAVSLVLFAAGWTLGLIGHVYRVETGAD